MEVQEDYKIDKRKTFGTKLFQSEIDRLMMYISNFYEGKPSEIVRSFLKDVSNKKWVKQSRTASFKLRKSCYNLDCRSLNFKEKDIAENTVEGECIDCGAEWLITKKKKDDDSHEY